MLQVLSEINQNAMISEMTAGNIDIVNVILIIISVALSITSLTLNYIWFYPGNKSKRTDQSDES